MFVGFACVLIAASQGFLTHMPPTFKAHFASTNESSGVFTQKKVLSGTENVFVSSGTWRIRPGKDFVWRITEPFDSVFIATPEKYVYSNEDEVVKRNLDDLQGFSRIAKIAQGDFAAFFDAFDAMYKEEDSGVFHMLAKPRERRLKKALERVDLDGNLDDWVLRAVFTSGDKFEIHVTRH